MVFSDDMADDQNLYDVRLSYNRMASLLVFVANAFTLMYVGKMNPEDSLWYGLVSGSFTFAVLTNASLTAENMAEFRRNKSQRVKEKSKPMGMRTVGQPMMPPQMMPQQMMPQHQMPQQQMIPQQQMQQQMPPQQQFIPPAKEEEKEYMDPVTGEFKPIQEAEMLD